MRWLENKELLQDWRLLDEWTPFQAACLLSDVCPPSDGTDDLSKAGLEYEPEISFFSDKEVAYFTEKAGQVMELKASIISNYGDLEKVNAIEIVRWAAKGGIVSQHHYLARKLLANYRYSSADDHIERLELEISALKAKLKDTGKHFLEARERVLEAALREIVRCVEGLEEPIPMRVDGINKSALAERIHDRRDSHGLQNGKFKSSEAIAGVLRKALDSKIPQKLKN